MLLVIETLRLDAKLVPLAGPARLARLLETARCRRQSAIALEEKPLPAVIVFYRCCRGDGDGA